MRFIVAPAQIDLGEMTVMLALPTVTLAVAVALQLFELVAVTVKLNPPVLLLLNVAVASLLMNVPPLLAQV